jgi:glutamate synthase (ferredoxin)
MLLACSYIHHSLNILKYDRNGIIIESGARKHQHFGTSITERGNGHITNMDADYAISNYNKAIAKVF